MRLSRYRVAVGLLAEQKHERRERILEAARGLVAEKGYEGMTMRDLAERSGVSVPTLYNLCGTKDELLFQAVAREVDATIDRLEGGGRTAGRRRLLALLTVGHEEMSRRPQYYRALLYAATRSEAARPPLMAVGSHLGVELHRALDEMVEVGELEEWVDTLALAERLGTICVLASFRWAAGMLRAEELLATTRYEAGLSLLGVTKGPARRAMEQLVRREQRALVARRRG
jgi:AcrR family transcriptional regulator